MDLMLAVKFTYTDSVAFMCPRSKLQEQLAGEQLTCKPADKNVATSSNQFLAGSSSSSSTVADLTCASGPRSLASTPKVFQTASTTGRSKSTTKHDDLGSPSWPPCGDSFFDEDADLFGSVSSSAVCLKDIDRRSSLNALPSTAHRSNGMKPDSNSAPSLFKSQRTQETVTTPSLPVADRVMLSRAFRDQQGALASAARKSADGACGSNAKHTMNINEFEDGADSEIIPDEDIRGEFSSIVC
jgi:hypothetical protein